MEFNGLEKSDLINFSPYISATLFVSGCNFRCPYCHNPDLVLSQKALPVFSEGHILKFLSDKKKWLDAVCITGGEPTLYPEIYDFILKLKTMGYLVKLDTNGTNPELLKRLLNVLDYVAMDVKAPLNKYKEITSTEIHNNSIKESINLIVKSGVDHEFRTTIVKELLTPGDIVSISKLIMGGRRYVLQKFRKDFPLLDSSFSGKTNYSKEELKSISGQIKDIEVIIREN